MASRIELMQEAAKRGILPEDKKPLFEEAVRRGLIGAKEPPIPMLASHTSEPPKISAGEVLTGAADNFLDSAGNVVGDIYQAVRHPIETGKALQSTYTGAVQKLLPEGLMIAAMDTSKLPPQLQKKPGEPTGDFRPQADALGSFMSDRYGGAENLKTTIRDDPAGFLLDLSTILTAGGSLGAKLPGMAGKVGEVVATAGRVTDPVNIAGKVMGKAPALIPGMIKQKFTPEALYESSMKFSNNPKVLTPVDRRTAIRTGLEEKMLPNEASYQRIWDTVGENRAKVNTIIADGAKAGDTVPVSEVGRFLVPLEKRAALVEKFSPEFAEVLREARANLQAYGDNIPVESAQALKETLQDLSKYGTDDRSRFAVAANKAMGRGLRIQLESIYPELKGLNRKSSALLTLENELAKATGRIGNRDVVSLGMKVALSGTPDVSKAAGLISSILDLPKVKARLAIAIFEGKTGRKIPSNDWRTAAKVISGHNSRIAAAQAGRVQAETMQNQPQQEQNQ